MALFSENNKPNTTFDSLVYIVTYPRVQIHKYLEADSENTRFNHFLATFLATHDIKCLHDHECCADCNVRLVLPGWRDLDLSQ